METHCPIEQWCQEVEEDIIPEVFLVVVSRRVETADCLAEPGVYPLALVVVVLVVLVPVVLIRFPVASLETAMQQDVLVGRLRRQAFWELVGMRSTMVEEGEEVITVVEAAVMRLVVEEDQVIVPDLTVILQFTFQEFRTVTVL
jgi:hypothetical protein